MKNKGALHFITILLLMIPLPAISQNTAEYYHDLRGMVDTAEVAHLFYRHYLEKKEPEGSFSITDDIMEFNIDNEQTTRFLQDYNWSFAYPLGDANHNIYSFAFFFHDPDNYIYTLSGGTPDLSGGIIRCDTGCVPTFTFLSAIIQSIGVADSSNSVYANMSYPYSGRTMISMDGGYHWKGYSFGQSYPSQDSLIHAAFLSVAPYNENLAFFDSTSADSVTYLKQTRDGGDILSIVDTARGSWQNLDDVDHWNPWNSSFQYDPDTTHIYAIVRVPRNGNTWYELRGSAKQGDAGSWQTLFQDTARFYLSLDHSQSGTFFLAKDRNIYKFDNYGVDIHLSQPPWQTLPDTSGSIVGIYKNPNEDIVYALTDSSLLKTTLSGVYTLAHITTGIEQTVSNRKPDKYVLHQNYPNPFNPTTTIRYELAKAGPVRMTIYNVLGQQISVLVDARQTAGVHQISFNASLLSSGVYFYRLVTGDHVLVRKMLLMK